MLVQCLLGLSPDPELEEQHHQLSHPCEPAYTKITCLLTDQESCIVSIIAIYCNLNVIRYMVTRDQTGECS